MSDVIDARHGVNGAPCRKKFRRDFNHLEETLGGQLAQDGEEMSLCGVDNGADREERAHDMYLSVLVNTYKGDALQAGDQHFPQREMRKEGV